MTCNDSAEDDHGWDHVVEFPHVTLPHISADMQRPMPAVFVQTKSHGANGLKVTMKLSNAVRLARSPSPAFVILRTSTEQDGKDEQIWYAIHFWDTLVERALKRAREASRDGISEDDFHKYSFNFTMAEVDRRTDDQLLSWIESTVLNIGGDYAAAKKALQPHPQIVGEITFGPGHSIEQFVDHQLGFTPSIPVKSITLNLRRFGVDIPFPMSKFTDPPTHFSMHANPVDQCDIWMRGPDGVSIEIVGDIIAPGIPNLPDDQHKIRIRAPMLDLICSLSGPNTLTAHFDPNAKWTPAELEKIVRFLSWSDQGDIDIRVTVRDVPLVSGTAKLSGNRNQGFFAQLAEQIGMLAMLSAHLKVTLPQISVADFHEAENVFNLYRFIHGTDMKLTFKPFADQPLPEIHEAVASGSACVGDWAFAVIQRFLIIQQPRSNGEIELSFGDPIVLQTCAFSVDDAVAITRFETDFERYACKKGVLSISNILSEFDKFDDMASIGQQQD